MMSSHSRPLPDTGSRHAVHVLMQVAALTSISRRPWVEDVCFALAGP
jgi:hypothetical protein